MTKEKIVKHLEFLNKFIQFYYGDTPLHSEIYEALSEALSEAIELIKQEPKTDLLDKARAEIESKSRLSLKSADYCNAIMWCLRILDKYKAESEE